MKKLLCCLLLLPALGFAQINKLLSGYVYVMAHDGSIGGGLTGNVELFNAIGIGPGVEVTSFEGRTLMPVFADLKVKHRFKYIEPYINGQFGYNVYSVDRTENVPLSTGGGQQSITYNQSGKFFYGAGAGVAWHFNTMGVFISYVYRGYKYRSPKSIAEDGQSVNFGTRSVNANVFTLGVVF
ncbi:hypothetical protein FHW36_103514 [Chitinophaga polysaccharea]|uniref:Outer membrane protein with beta-barrel domain n=1 Tax=Chitinophaga polysaccharea TaxID=1293035 RepID=A0A561PUD0_9BACT|nr:hypothetical protein [Chitinophaga polysaccharea]TWF41710.1 hypothetical protein FHW36_103514 [Chitinophaga polysaccharea]